MFVQITALIRLFQKPVQKPHIKNQEHTSAPSLHTETPPPPWDAVLLVKIPPSTSVKLPPEEAKRFVVVRERLLPVRVVCAEDEV